MADKVSDWRAVPRPDPGQPKVREGGKTKVNNLKAWEGCSKSSAGRTGSNSEVKVNRESARTRPSMSFAEMAKKGSGGDRDVIEKSKINLNKGGVGSSEGGSRQTGPCLSQVPLIINQTLIAVTSIPGGAESDFCLHVWQDWEIS